MDVKFSITENLKTAIVYSPEYLAHDPGKNHPENPERLKWILKGIKERKLLESGKCEIIEPRLASMEEVKLVHDEAYVKMIEEICKRGGGALDEDTILCSKSYHTALLAAGGAIKACEVILEGKYKNAFALVRPPGHHAGRFGCAMSVTSQGFCIFNNVAIAAKSLIEHHKLSRILIVDIDVHHGNGTQEIFNNSKEVLYIGFHEKGIYPNTGFPYEIGEGNGKGFKVNIALPAGSADDVYLKAFNDIVLPLSKKFEPEFLLVSAGFDAYKDDPIAHMRLSENGYFSLFEKLNELAEGFCEGRIVSVLEGGYNLEALSRIVPIAIATMAGIPTMIEEEPTFSKLSVKKKAEEEIRETKENVFPFWK